MHFSEFHVENKIQIIIFFLNLKKIYIYIFTNNFLFPHTDEPSFSIGRNPEFGIHIVPGMQLVLTCDLDANPAAQTKWIRDGEKNANQSLSSDNIVDTSALNNAQLIFKEISEANTGWYKCIADQPNFGHFESYGYFLAVRCKLLIITSSRIIFCVFRF